MFSVSFSVFTSPTLEPLVFHILLWAYCILISVITYLCANALVEASVRHRM